MKNTVKNDEVFIEETFNASIERVYEAWTKPENLLKWYAPEGCNIHFENIEIKPGGKYHCCISNPKYGDCWCIGEYQEMIPNAKIVFTMINADENGKPINPVEIGMSPDWPGSTLVTVTLAEENGKTKLRLRQTVSQALAQKTGAYPSWIQMLNKMKLLVQQ